MSSSIVRTIFAYEMPHTPKNLFRYMGCVVGGAIFLAWLFRDTVPVWWGVLLFYVVMRLLSWVLQYTPFAKSELLE